MSVVENIQNVRAKIAAAAEKSGRTAEDVLLLAVSKTKPVEMLREAYEAGARDFGENKVQEILAKEPKLPEDIRWHMIGHLQTNKVRQIVGKTCLIHSVDSVRLAEEIHKESVKKGLVTQILLEVNVAEEESKFGFHVEEVEDALKQIQELSGVCVRGLMTIAPFVDNPEDNRPVFQKLNKLYVDMKTKNIDNDTMNILSMGMTGDFEVAVEEGATMVRVGTGIFGAR